MNTEYLITFLHDLATAAWVGGMIFLVFLRKELEGLGPDFGIVLVKASKVFTRIAWSALIVLVLTGIVLTSLHGGMARVQRDWVLNVKHALVLLAILNALFLTFKASPMMVRLTPTKGSRPSAEFLRWKRRLETGADLNLVLGILIILFSVL